MSTLNDLRYNSLHSQGYTGTFNDEEYAWLFDGGCTIPQLNDRWKCFLGGKGYTGNHNDMLWDYLGDLGCTGGTLMDRWYCALRGGLFYGASCSGSVVTVGNDGTFWGYVDTLIGSINPDTTSNGTFIFAVYATSTDHFIMRYGVAGDEQVKDGAGDPVEASLIEIDGLGPVPVQWDAGAAWYSGTYTGVLQYFQDRDGEDICLEVTTISDYILYSATYRRETYESLPLAIGAPPISTTHAVPMWAWDWEGVAREFAVDEPVWKGGRRVTNHAYRTNALDTWTAGSATVTDGISDPDGGADAFTVTTTNNNGYINLSMVGIPAVEDLRASVYIRRRTGTGTIMLFANAGYQSGQEITITDSFPLPVFFSIFLTSSISASITHSPYQGLQTLYLLSSFALQRNQRVCLYQTYTALLYPDSQPRSHR